MSRLYLTCFSGFDANCLAGPLCRFTIRGFFQPYNTNRGIAQTSPPTHTQDIRMPFPFQRLPPEIRHMIYDLALSIPGEISPISFGFRGTWSRPGNNHPKPSICVGIVRTCEEIRAEAAAVLYGGNKFLLTDTRIPGNFFGSYAFLVKIGRRNRYHLRHLIFNIPNLEQSTWATENDTTRVIGDCFELLALGHRLDILDLRFGGVQLTNARIDDYRRFFVAKSLVVPKLKRIKAIRELKTSGHASINSNFSSADIPCDACMQCLRDEMLVGSQVAVLPNTTSRNQNAGKPLTERLAGLEKGLEALRSSHRASVSKERVAKIVKEELQSLHEDLAAEAQVSETVTREQMALGLAGLSRDLAVLGKKLDSLNARIG